MRPLHPIYFTAVVQLLAATCSAQEEVFLGKFMVTVEKRQVQLAWTLLQGSNCNGTEILRSTDSMNFQQIGRIVGVCGSSARSISYNFIDPQPVLNARNFYQLKFGGNIFSLTLGVDVRALNDQGYQLRPNPINEQARLFFENDNNASATLRIYDATGRMVSQDSTNSDVFVLNRIALMAGVYQFSIQKTTADKPIVGSIVVMQ